MAYPNKYTDATYGLRTTDFGDSDVNIASMSDNEFVGGLSNKGETQTLLGTVPDAHNENWFRNYMHKWLRYCVSFLDELKNIKADYSLATTTNIGLCKAGSGLGTNTDGSMYVVNYNEDKAPRTVYDVPVGVILLWTGSTVPQYFIEVAGETLNKTSYAILYKYAQDNGLIGTGKLFEEVDSTNFKIADERTEAKPKNTILIMKALPSPTKNMLPAGTIIMVANGVVPDGYIKANGAWLNRTTYATLFSALGTMYGAGDGSTSFAVPDCRGEFPRFADDGRGVDVGRGVGSWQADAIRNIYGEFIAVGADDRNDLSVAGGISTSLFATWWTSGMSYRTQTSSGGGSCTVVDFNASRVVPTAGENRGRNIALMALIKY